jgi:hypothetical protein
MMKGNAMGYLFDRDFDAERSDEFMTPDDQVAPIYTEEELRAAEFAARAEGFEAGRTHGKAEALEAAKAARAEERHDALLALATQLQMLCEDAASHRCALETQMTEFALVACERIVPEILRTKSTIRAAAEVRRCLGQVLRSSRIRVFLSQKALEEHRALIEATIRDRHLGTSRWSLRPTRLTSQKATRGSNGTTASCNTASARLADQLLDALRKTRSRTC